MDDKARIIVDSYEFEPTDEQLMFCNAMAGFLTSPLGEKCFILKGYAGTGKTTSLAALVRALPKFGIKSVLLAPTGRAAKVMSNYTGRKALTLHKRIYRKKSVVGTDLSFHLAPNLAEQTLFIIDEASMIADELQPNTGSSLLRDLMKYVYNQKNCVALFVGDTAQLPPVGSLDSPALNGEQLAVRFGLDIREVELKQVVRQEKKSGILANATMLRQLIFSQNYQPGGDTPKKAMLPKFISRGFPDVFRMTGVKLVEGLEYAQQKFGVEQTLIVCRSNKSANVYNQQIRARILYREEELTGGDQIMVVKNNYFWLPENESAAFIANGDMAVVKRVRRQEERYGLRFCEAVLEFLDFPEAGELTCKVMLDVLTAESSSLAYEQGNKLFEGLNEDYGYLTNKRERFNAIRDDPYFNALQIKFAYAITCHKAQGGQWDAVFVDQGYLTDDMVDVDFLRWVYTAITRAKKELFLVNFSEKLFNTPAED